MTAPDVASRRPGPSTCRGYRPDRSRTRAVESRTSPGRIPWPIRAARSGRVSSSRVARLADAPHPDQADDREEQVRQPHREERRDHQAVAQLLAPDQPHVVDGEYRDAHADHQSHPAAVVAQRDGRTHQGEDDACRGDRVFLLDLHFVPRGALVRRADALLLAGRRTDRDEARGRHVRAWGRHARWRGVRRRRGRARGRSHRRRREWGASGGARPSRRWGGRLRGGRLRDEPRHDLPQRAAIQADRRRVDAVGRRRLVHRRQPGEPPQIVLHGGAGVLARPLGLATGLSDHAPHLADRHLPVALVGVVLGALQRVADPRDAHAVDAEEGAVELRGIGPIDRLDVAILEREVQIAAAGGICHATRVGADDPPALGVSQVVNRSILELVGIRVDTRSAQEELPGHDLVDDLFFQREGRLLALNVDLQRAEPVIGARQHLIVPQEREQRDDRRAGQHRPDHATHAHAARLHRRDLVVAREMREYVQHRHEHRHRQRHRDDERDGQHEHLENDAPRQPLAHETPELLGDLVEEHQRGERRQREAERRDVLSQQVAADGAHGRSRHYIRGSTSLQVPFQLMEYRHRAHTTRVGTAQGMRRPTLVGLVALSLVIPQAHAQDTAAVRVRAPRPPRPPGFVAKFSWTSLAPPQLAALLPGGRLGLRTSPAAVAATWARRVRAARRAGLAVLAQPPVAVAESAAAAPEAPTPPVPPAGLRGILGTYADIGMELRVRFELKADRFQNLKCTPFEQQQALSGCQARFPTISPVPQYSVRTAGIVGRRLHVNVDFDSQREFDANNNLQVWYEGLEDEVLRRVEAGNVTFQAPPSRFISAAIPANNFGVQAVAQLGALEFRGIYAQQKGNVVRDRVYSVGETTTQPIARMARDLDYEAGRFFFAVDPALIPRYPAVYVLNIDRAILPDSLRVGSVRVYRVRAASPTSTTNQNIGGVRAVACGPGPTRSVDCDVQRAGPFQWELLLEGKDYYVDPSGAWFALASRLDQSDYLAVSYIPVGAPGCGPTGRCVGTFPAAASRDTAVVDTLRLVYDPRPGVTAATPSFRFEIRSAYRVGGSEVDRTTVALALTVNQRERTVLGAQTYLAQLGMALESDPTRFDQYNRLFPRTRDPQQGAPLRDYFAVFPHLTPFADTARLAPVERNDSLYRTPRLLLLTQSPPSVFALGVHASVSASSDRSQLSLNSFQIRDGSEKIYLGSQLLVRDADYSIDYATGQVTFKNPDSLFQGGTAQVRAQFEERAAFAVAPTSIYGLAARS